ncbi:hypothetical protein V6N12_009173 [Hibiscus sabdariffa]|uniref:Uncharacterized protein n=1 Tax=Hibiscus sabdariffa TaxID=183260 RepID=A0ABR2C593_9ROSI
MRHETLLLGNIPPRGIDVSLTAYDDSFKWQAPPRDWLCLNIDAAISLPECSGTIVGVFQESSGEWNKGYLSNFFHFENSLFSICPLRV